MIITETKTRQVTIAEPYTFSYKDDEVTKTVTAEIGPTKYVITVWSGSDYESKNGSYTRSQVGAAISSILSAMQ